MASEKHLQQAQRHLAAAAPPWIPIGTSHRADSAGKRDPSVSYKGDEGWLASSRRSIKLARLVTVLLSAIMPRGPGWVAVGGGKGEFQVRGGSGFGWAVKDELPAECLDAVFEAE